jgi:hypothetical protein
MSTKINLDELYSNVMPYLSDPITIKMYLDSFNQQELDKDELIDKIETKIKASEGTLQTDFRIILNTINQF